MGLGTASLLALILRDKREWCPVTGRLGIIPGGRGLFGVHGITLIIWSELLFDRSAYND